MHKAMYIKDNEKSKQRHVDKNKLFSLSLFLSFPPSFFLSLFILQVCLFCRPVHLHNLEQENTPC